MIEVKKPVEVREIKRLYLGFDQVARLLSKEAFEIYTNLHKHIYAVWEPELSYFEIDDFFSEEVELVCLTLKELEDYFINGGKKYATR